MSLQLQVPGQLSDLILPTFPFELFVIVLGTLLKILTLLIVGYLIDRSLDKIYVWINNALKSQFGVITDPRLLKNTLKVSLWVIMGILILSTIPGIGEGTLSIMSLAIAGLVAFSSTSIIANAMNGVMVRIVKPYKVGDVVNISNAEDVGIVRSIGFLYTKVEDAKRRVYTIPSTVVMRDEVINYTEDNYVAHCNVGIGYDVPRDQVEKALIKAAKAIKLDEPFVLVNKLGDYSIVYQINGTTTDVANIISIESNLKKSVLDACANAKIEITSPVYQVNRYIEKVLDSTIPETPIKPKKIKVEKGVTADIAKEAIKEQKKKVKEAQKEAEAVVEELKEAKEKL